MDLPVLLSFYFAVYLVAPKMNPTKDTLLILPCGGTKAHGCLVSRAAQQLVLEGKAEWFSPGMIEDIFAAEPANKGSVRVIVVDGCHKECGLQLYKDRNITPEFHLSLEDIGIDGESEEFDENDLQLVKDAIIAVSTRPSEVIPMIPGCCC